MKKISLKLTSSLLFLFAYFLLSAQGGGMWIPNQLNEQEMKQMGLKISTQKIFNPNSPSIKDAIAHFDGGCTSEVISPKGLILTNYHCGYGQIQAHSTVENDLLTNGFWAKDLNDELANPGMEVTFIVDIKDVTDKILENVTDNLTQKQREEIIKKNIAAVSKTIKTENFQSVMIRPFYNGNQYYAFITETFEDIRLVGAPPSSIGKFGSDTDNWVWPRHTGDFSLFRIYADKNNHPAKYSKENIPYVPKYYLPISIKGIKTDDFTMVYGFPGRTQEYLPSFAIEQTLETLNPAKISLRDETLKIWNEKMRINSETKIKYAAKYASIANGWKKWIGESQGLRQSNALQTKKNYEAEFTKIINSKPDLKSKYGNLLSDFEKIYTEDNRYVKGSAYFNEAFYINSETFRMAVLLLNLSEVDTQRFESAKNQTKSRISDIYKNYDAELDGKASAKLLSMYSSQVETKFQASGFENYKELNNAQNIVNSLWEKSMLTDNKNTLINLLSESDNQKIKDQINNDPIVNFVRPYLKVYRTDIQPNYDSYQAKLDSLQRIYMKAQLVAFPNKKFFPDANSTLRVTYGKVDGYSPRDAVEYKEFTTLDGVMEKYIPGDYEFDVSPKLIDLYNKKEYGVYGKNGKMPVNFIATNHTTGGNSGSPALDANGNLIGLNFDRVWEGTMSDLNYDPKICRNIMVDIRYVLFIIDKYAGAQRLLDEMKILK